MSYTKRCGSCGSSSEKFTPSHDCEFALCQDCVDSECWDCGSYFDPEEISKPRHLCCSCQSLFDELERKMNV